MSCALQRIKSEAEGSDELTLMGLNGDTLAYLLGGDGKPLGECDKRYMHQADDTTQSIPLPSAQEAREKA